MKPAVVLNRKDVVRLLRVAAALTKLADELAGEAPAPTKVRKPRPVRVKKAAVEEAS